MKLSSGGRKISLTKKPINRDGVIDGTLKEDHSLQISVENLRLRDDHGNQKKDQMDNIDVSQNMKPEARPNNGDVLPQDKLRHVLEPEVLVNHNRDTEVDRL